MDDLFGDVFGGVGGVFGNVFALGVIPEPMPTPWRGGGVNLFTPRKRKVRHDSLEEWLAVGFSLEIAIALSEDDDHA